MTFSIDEVDWKLLQLVQENCKMAYAELGERVGLSVSAVNERLKKLHAVDVIRGYTALLNPRALGLDVCAFIQVSIERPQDENAFLRRVEALPEVQECHHITGEFSFLLKVRVHTTGDLETLIKGKIKTLSGVVRTHTLIALSTVKETPGLHLESRPDLKKRKGR
jgi:Lrp/AsnC family transcriptional regulator, leucine-responsive regulatory protein